MTRARSIIKNAVLTFMSAELYYYVHKHFRLCHLSSLSNAKFFTSGVINNVGKKGLNTGGKGLTKLDQGHKLTIVKWEKVIRTPWSIRWDFQTP